MLVDVHTIAPSVDALLAGAERREPFVNPDGRSAALFERVWIDGAPHVVKYLHADHDFTMRVSGDVRCRTVRAWAAGLLDAAPDLVDHAIVGAALGHGRNGWGAALLMRDVSADLLPDGTRSDPDGPARPLPRRRRRVLRGDLGLARRPGVRSGAAALRRPLGVVRACRVLRASAPWAGPSGCRSSRPRDGAGSASGHRLTLARLVDPLRHDVTPLADALRQTPSCFLHGDVKASNTGMAADGRTVLIDWAYVGRGPGVPRAGVAPGARPGTAPGLQGGDRRGLPRRARAPRRRHRRVVGPPARSVPAGRGGAVRLGEGAGRRRRAGLVVRRGPGRRRAGCDRRLAAAYSRDRRRVAARPRPHLRPPRRGAPHPLPRAAAGAPCPRRRRGHRRGEPRRARRRRGGSGRRRRRGRGCSPTTRRGVRRPWPATRSPCPSRTRSFDAAVAAFSLNHLTDPAAACGRWPASRVPAARWSPAATPPTTPTR